MWESKCCICGETTESPYCVIKHLDDGVSRIYEGHKRYLGIIETKLRQGIDLEFTEYDRTKI